MTTTITIVIDNDQGTLVAKDGSAGIVGCFAVDNSPGADDAEATITTELAAAFVQMREIKISPPSTTPAAKPKPTAASTKKPAVESKKAAAPPPKPTPAADADGFGQVDMFAF